MLRVNKVHRVSTVTTTVEILQGPAWTLIRGPRWRVEKQKSTWLVLYCAYGDDNIKIKLIGRSNLRMVRGGDWDSSTLEP